MSNGVENMNDCELCGDYCYPKEYNWEGKIVCLDCFLWYANKHKYEVASAIEE